MVKIYTGKGDDGTTGLLFGGRVRKDAPSPTANGDVDEAQASIGVARALAGQNGDAELHDMLLDLARDLWVVMGELATAPENLHKLSPDARVSAEMVGKLEGLADRLASRFPMPTEFVIPGQNPIAAALDVARTVVRRSERSALAVAADDSHVIPYLNRLSTVLWALARWQEGESVKSRPR